MNITNNTNIAAHFLLNSFEYFYITFSADTKMLWVTQILVLSIEKCNLKFSLIQISIIINFFVISNFTLDFPFYQALHFTNINFQELIYEYVLIIKD